MHAKDDNVVTTLIQRALENKLLERMHVSSHGALSQRFSSE
jgi:hypothetical protein